MPGSIGMLSVMVVVQILTRRADSLIMASSDVLGSVGRSKVLSWGSTLFGQAEKNRTCWSVVFPRAPPKIHGILLIFHHFPIFSLWRWLKMGDTQWLLWQDPWHGGLLCPQLSGVQRVLLWKQPWSLGISHPKTTRIAVFNDGLMIKEQHANPGQIIWVGYGYV